MENSKVLKLNPVTVLMCIHVTYSIFDNSYVCNEYAQKRTTTMATMHCLNILFISDFSTGPQGVC